MIRHFVKNDYCFLRLVLIVVLFVGQLDLQAQSGTVQVTLSPVASPSTAQPGVTVVNVTGSNFPSGTITPAQVTVNLVPATTGPAMTASVTAVTTIVGSTRRITFQFTGANVTSPTA